MQLNAVRKTITLGLLAATLSTPVLADSSDLNAESPSVGAMVVDAVVLRPVYFVLSQAGAVVYSATLPFTLLGGNADSAAEAMVVTPLQAAFVRCLGCGEVPYEVSEVDEGEGKTVEHFVEVSAGTAGYTSESEKVSTVPFGIHAGTRWELVDGSRFDVMLGYASLGTADVKSSDVGPFEDQIQSIQIGTRFGKEIVSDLDLMFKLGVHQWKTEREVNGASAGSASGFGLFYGAGGEYRLSDMLGAGVSYTRYDMSKSSENYEAGINAVDLNLRVYF